MITKLKKKLKNIKLKADPKLNYLRKGVTCNYEWYGSDNGGFYACPDFIDENPIVYSFGIGQDISFDKSMIKKHTCTVFGFDPTPKSIQWVKDNVTEKNFKFYEFGIGEKTEKTTFFLPLNEMHVSGSYVQQSNVSEIRSVEVQMKSLFDIAKELGHDHINVLKMDIEGAEYDIIEGIINSNLKIDQILIEFHDRFFEEKLKSQKVVEMFQNKGYEIFAVSDTFEEVSFIKKGLL